MRMRLQVDCGIWILRPGALFAYGKEKGPWGTIAESCMVDRAQGSIEGSWPSQPLGDWMYGAVSDLIKAYVGPSWYLSHHM